MAAEDTGVATEDTMEAEDTGDAGEVEEDEEEALLP